MKQRTFDLPEPMLELLKIQAARFGISQGEAMRQALSEWLRSSGLPTCTPTSQPTSQHNTTSTPTSPHVGEPEPTSQPTGTPTGESATLAHARGEDSSCIPSVSPLNPEKKEKTDGLSLSRRRVEPYVDPDDVGDADAAAVIWIPISPGSVPVSRTRGPARRTGRGWEYGVSREQVEEWSEAYPGVDVLQALRECRQWNLADPSRKKTYGGILKHLHVWLSKEQNKRKGGNGLALPFGKPADPRRASGAHEPESSGFDPFKESA